MGKRAYRNPDHIRRRNMPALKSEEFEVHLQEYPVEAVLEIANDFRRACAIAGFLDPDSLSFVDCQPLTRGERDFGRIAS